MLSLSGKTIVVTGATSGIGHGCAQKASELGATIIMVGRDEERVAKSLGALFGKNHRLCLVDLQNVPSLAPGIEAVLGSDLKIDGFIHSAGLELTLPLRTGRQDQFQEILAVNVLSGFEIARVLSQKKYLPEKGASYVFLSSVMGIVGQPGKTFYGASKGAVIAGVKSMAIELASKKIRVNCLLPGVVQTPMTEKMFNGLPVESVEEMKKMHPLGLGNVDDVTWPCMFLLSDLARWVTGVNWIVDGGYTAR